jgi:hypothetical protein
MSIFAVLQDNNVINLIVAETKEIAEEITGKTCMEDTDKTAKIGGFWNGSMFVPPKPLDSWVLNDEYEWVPPIAMPDDGYRYYWHEISLSWIKEPGQ